ncbi:hypothetical protein HY485_00210 [Candidatus Woesearchaeota archaeon]|nr:hypothetical protein [Candidatus Woesearchaeota archaeon]
MKKVFIMMIIALILATSTQAIRGAEIKASILRYEPAPAEQGNTFDVWVQLSNSGTKAERAAVKFVPEYPFSLPAGQKQETDADTIAATENKVVKFTIFADSNAPNGDKNIKFLYKYGTSNQWINLESPITLETQNAILVVDDYAVTPSPAVPGQTANIELKLRNAGRIAIKNIDVGIDLEDGKFSTIGSGTKKRLNYISAGETETVSFQLASDTSTQVKVYTIPVTLSYQDERNKKYSDTAKISLVVNALPELSLTVDSTKFESRKKPGTVTIKTVNKGIVNLKYVTIKLLTGADYEILNPSDEVYIGNLDSDDFETANFLIKPLADNPKLNIQLDFKDPYNVDFKQKYSLQVRIITESELGKNTSFIPITIILLIIAGGIIYQKFYRKKR